jgi:hypothetical protein
LEQQVATADTLRGNAAAAAALLEQQAAALSEQLAAAVATLGATAAALASFLAPRVMKAMSGSLQQCVPPPLGEQCPIRDRRPAVIDAPRRPLRWP